MGKGEGERERERGRGKGGKGKVRNRGPELIGRTEWEWGRKEEEIEGRERVRGEGEEWKVNLEGLEGYLKEKETGNDPEGVWRSKGEELGRKENAFIEA